MNSVSAEALCDDEDVTVDEHPTRWFLDQAREFERDLVDRITSSKDHHLKCERRVQQLQLAIDSDLFVEFDEENSIRLREFAARVRVQYRLLAKSLEEAHRIADQCDEALTQHDVAAHLRTSDRQTQAVERLKHLLDELRSLYRESEVVCAMVRQHSDDQQTIFERLRR